MIPALAGSATPALAGLFAGRTAMRMGGKPAQDAGDVPSAWDEPKAHTRDPTPTQLDTSDPKAKQTHIPEGESFEEYMKRRASQR
mmetsp:Transcript_66549/g.106701  ORF Transcript_66549/g.106701 Transcript_66549/m.106701 type:complete len:85 (+) Transcript_66549:2-256(+)